MKFLFSLIIIFILLQGCRTHLTVIREEISTVQSLEENEYEIAGKEIHEGLITIYGKGE